jgi:hypothetical protein
MKWFTREWATGELSDQEWERVPVLYDAHLALISDRLSPDALALASAVNIHDGHVKKSRHSGTTIELQLVVGDLQSGYQWVVLLFVGASLLDPASLDELHLDAAHTELLYDEIDLADDGLFDYRVLVWPRGELAIRFSAVTISTRTATASDR